MFFLYIRFFLMFLSKSIRAIKDLLIIALILWLGYFGWEWYHNQPIDKSNLDPISHLWQIDGVTKDKNGVYRGRLDNSKIKDTKNNFRLDGFGNELPKEEQYRQCKNMYFLHPESCKEAVYGTGAS